MATLFMYMSRLTIRHIVGVKVLNLNARLVALERKCQLLELEEYKFHAFESTLLYKEKVNDAKVLVKFMP